MEKFRIAQYGFIQMVALAYGILGSGLVAKGAKTMMEQGIPISPTWVGITLFHDYGIFLSLVIVGWAFFCAYHSSIFSGKNIHEDTIVASGLIVTAFFFLLGTAVIVISFGAFFTPNNSV